MAVFSVLQTPQLFLETLDPVVSLVGSLLAMVLLIFVTPVFYAGTIGMANDAAVGTKTSFGRFWRHAKEFYISVLIAYLFIMAVTFGFGFAVSIGILVAFVVGVSGGGLPLMLGVAGVVGLLVLAFLIVLFAVHFYAHAIVIEGAGPVDGLSRSVNVVRHNLKPVVGYGLVSLMLGGLFGGVFALVITFAFPSAPAPGEPAPMPDLVPALVGSGASIVGTTLFITFFLVFSVVFYRTLVEVGEEPIQAGEQPIDHGADSFDRRNPTE